MSVLLKDFITAVDAKVISTVEDYEDIEVSGAYVSDLLSDVMGNARDNQIWITIMRHLNVVAVASLAGMPAICFACNVVPDEQVIKKANDEDICLITTSKTTFETAGILYTLFRK
ncbi:MAG: hypothetical protein WC234_02010 [Endomicrobiaceae bacterium]